MPLPNTTGVQNAGVNPNDVQQKNDVNQAMNTFFREFSAKMDNILNVRGNVQAGVFNSFGNNALTRGGMGITDLLTDTIKGMFTEKEKEKEDPVVKALRTQHAVLVEISKTMLKVDERLFNIDEAAYGIRLDIKNQFSKGNPPSLAPPEKIVEENLVWPKLDAPNPEPKVNPISEVVDPEFNINNFLKRESATGVGDVSPTPAQDITQPVSGAKDFNFSSLLRKESATDAVDISENPKEEIKQTSILDSILSVLMSSDKKLDKLVKDKPITTREDELAAKRVKPESSDIISPQSSITESLVGVINSIKSVFTKGIGGVIGQIVVSLASLLSPSVIGPILIRAMTSKLGLVTGGAIAAIAGTKKVYEFEQSRGVPDELSSLTPTASGDIAPQNAIIEEHQKYEDRINVEKNTRAAEVKAAAQKNAPKPAPNITLDNKYLDEQYKNLSALPITIKKVQSDVTSNVNAIEQGQLELKKAQSQQQTSPVRQAAPVIQSSSTTNNQTIMPTRSYPTNTEPGYRRYMDNMLVGG